VLYHPFDTTLGLPYQHNKQRPYMKTMYLEPADFKAFTIGVGISVGFLVLSFLITFYGEARDKIYNRTAKPVPTTQSEPIYTEVRGMN